MKYLRGWSFWTLLPCYNLNILTLPCQTCPRILMLDRAPHRKHDSAWSSCCIMCVRKYTWYRSLPTFTSHSAGPCRNRPLWDLKPRHGTWWVMSWLLCPVIYSLWHVGRQCMKKHQVRRRKKEESNLTHMIYSSRHLITSCTVLKVALPFI